MGSRFRISNLAIEGFRGINNRMNIDLNGNAAVLFGPNGVGKSSVMQAVEWGLFGGLVSAVVGPAEFKKEDAVVNSFHSQKKATVEVILEDEKGKRVKLIRERKLGRSTTAGKTELKVEVEGKEYSDDVAQSELNRLLRITPTEFYASTYLHQEAIRDLIVGDPLLRSEVIDKLLGLHFVRELIDYLPVKHVGKEAKGIEEEIEDIKNRKMQEVVISRKRLAELEAGMEKSGIDSSKLNLQSLVKLVEKSSEDISEIAANVKVKVKELEKPTLDLSSSEKTLGQMRKVISELEKAWTNVYKEKVSDLSILKSTKQNYEEALNEVASLETKEPKDLRTKKSGISDQISKMDTELRAKISARKFLQDESVAIGHLCSNLNDVRGELEEIKKEFGAKSSIEETLKKLESEISDRIKAIKKEESLGSVLVSGLDYLKSTLPKGCPLCKSDIVYQDVVSALEKEIGERESAKIVRRLQNESEDLSRQKTRIERALESLSKLEGQLVDLESGIDGERDKLKKKEFEPKDDLVKYVDDELERIGKQISEIDERMRALKSEAIQVDSKLEELEKKIRKLSSVEKQAQELLGVTEKKEKLVNLLAERIGDSNQDIETLEGVTENIRATKTELEVCQKILDFLNEKDRVDQLEKGLPLLQKRLKDLEKKYSEIKELETGLTDIHQAATTAREELVKKALSELQSTIGSYYSKILGHPYFVNLQLIPEEERGKAIYRIRAWDKDFKQGTYVQTRFSNAQMNAVALSLFLSMSTRLQSNLGLILLDDPSQSMDKAHKDALCKLLGEILEERQVFVATHDTEFEQCLRKSLDKAKAKICEIERWDIKGPELSS
jgi:exonuclease SbcC